MTRLRISYSDPARDELTAAIDALLTENPFSAEKFLLLVTGVLTNASEFPEAHHEVKPGLRRIVIRRFRYNLYYRRTADELQVVAVLHASIEQDRALRER